MSTTVTGQWRRHVAAFAFPFGNHPTVLLLLVRKLAESSPDVVFTFFGTEESTERTFKYGPSPLPNIVPHVVHDGVPDGHVISEKEREPIKLFLKEAEVSLKKGIEEAEAKVGVKISCVVSDAFMWFCGGIAAEIGASWVAFWTSGAASLSAHINTDVFRSKFGRQGLEARKDELVGTIPGFSTVRVRDLQEGVVLGDFSSPFSKMLHSMATVLPNATATVLNIYEEQERDVVEDLKVKLKNYINVGPLSLLFPHQAAKSDDYGCIPFLEGRAPASVAYIAFGTLVIPPPHELVALAEALEASGITFIWSLKENAVALLPDGFKERTEGRGKVVPWAPQIALLAHPAVGVFVSHGGWNSAVESIMAGVPMICRPFFGDHMLNTRYVETVWKIGIAVDVFTKTGTLDALERVIRTEEGKQMRANVTALKCSVESAVPTKGSSNKDLESLIELVTE